MTGAGWSIVALVCGGLLGCDALLGMGDLELTADAPATDEGRWAPAPRGREGAGDDGDDNEGADQDAASPEGRHDGGAPIAARKRVFVTSRLVPPNFGNVAAGHAICRDTAARAGLRGEWVAWLSGDGARAIDSLTSDGPYELLDGTLVAPRKAALLEGTLAAPIDVSEDGKKVPKGVGVWTGTRSGSQPGESCANWTDHMLVKVGTAGSIDHSDGRWTDNGGEPLVSAAGWRCSWTARLYCFER